MTYAMTNHLRKSNTCRSPHGMTHFQRYECASCAARTTCFNIVVDAAEAYRIVIVDNEDTTKTYDEILVINMNDAMYEEAEAEDTNKTNQPNDPMNISAAEQATIDANDTICIELAHREALAEDNERDARDWEAFKGQIAVTKTEEIETAHVEALAEDNFKRAQVLTDELLAANARTCDQYAEPAAATLCIGFDAELRAWFAFTLENSQVTASWELSAGSAAEAWTEAQQLNAVQE